MTTTKVRMIAISSRPKKISGRHPLARLAAVGDVYVSTRREDASGMRATGLYLGAGEALLPEPLPAPWTYYVVARPRWKSFIEVLEVRD